MPSQHIPSAILSDVEAALVEQYGRANVREKQITDAHSNWAFRITDKSWGRCVASMSDEGTTLMMSPYTSRLLWISAAVGYLFFIVPGVALTAWIFITRFITARVIGFRFSKMVANVEQVTAKRTHERPLDSGANGSHVTATVQPAAS